MNERGFFTILGLCLLTVAAIFIKGIPEFETNYSRGITSFQIEHKLQNLAESYLIENIDFAETLLLKHNLGNVDGLENVTVEIYGKRGNIQFYRRVYRKNENYKDEAIKNDEGENLSEDGTIILSVASCNSPFISGKIYRRAFAYILDDDRGTVHFMNDL